MTGRRRPGDDPVPIADALAAVGRELGLPDPELLAALQACWGEVFGEDLAAHVVPRGLRDGTLRVVVSDALRATQVRYRAAELVERMGAILGPGAVVRMQVSLAAKPG